MTKKRHPYQHQPANTTTDTLNANRHLYSIDHWSDGYFGIGSDGRLEVYPNASKNTATALQDLVLEARQAGLKTPLLIHFPDISRHRRDRLIGAFETAIKKHSYTGAYQLVYPIKVNQHRHVVEGLLRHSDDRFGLEAGSKPELLIALAHGHGKTVVCNGYKDRNFIRLALMGRLMGVNTVIVVEKPRDLTLIFEEAKNLTVEPVLGVRMRLSTVTSGQWQNSGGQKAKFGLMPGQLLTFLEQLRKHGKSHWLRLLHFHMGSQVANLDDIRQAVEEISRYYAEVHAQGFHPDTLDIGGGLAVDYEGARSRDAFSMNYDIDEYAHTVVATVAEQCRRWKLPQPDIISESGRALSAHHSVLITNITDSENPLQRPPVPDGGPDALCQAVDTLATDTKLPASERYFRARAIHEKGLRAFAEGSMALSHRAWLDYRILSLYQSLLGELRLDDAAEMEIYRTLSEWLAHKYFANFSVFESTPDVWGIDQVFPIAPLTQLNCRPANNAIIHDLTCDSDGRIKRYVAAGHLQSWLPLHPPGDDYLIGVFLTGAYQETLGDIHNLFGDTHSVVVEIRDNTLRIIETRKGDTSDQLLDYVGYNVATIEQRLNRLLAASSVDDAQRENLQLRIHQELYGYTYLENTP